MLLKSCRNMLSRRHWREMLQAEGHDPNVSRFCSKNSEIGIYRISDTVAVSLSMKMFMLNMCKLCNTSGINCNLIVSKLFLKHSYHPFRPAIVNLKVKSKVQMLDISNYNSTMFCTTVFTLFRKLPTKI